MKYLTPIIICSLLLISTFIPCASAKKRRHNGPGANESETVLHGRTTTEHGEKGHGTSVSLSTLDGEDEHDMSTDRQSRRIVDFALHLKRPVVIWSEVKEDGVQLQSCHLNKKTRRAKFTLSGSGLHSDDYARGVVFVLGVEEYTKCLGSPVPEMRGIDASDGQLFLSIKQKRTETGNNGSEEPEEGVHLVAKVVPGSTVCPQVDIAIHKEPEPEVDAMVAPVEYEDEPHSPWTAHFLTLRQVGPGGDDVMLPNVAERISVPEQEVSLGGDSKMKVSGAVDVKLTSFSINRSIKLQLSWQMETSAAISGQISITNSLDGSRSIGELVRANIPSLSFSINIPIVASLSAGGLVGAYWVKELSATRSLSTSFEGSYAGKHDIRMQVFPPRINIEPVSSSGSGSGSFSAQEGNTGTVVSGFYGLRPVVKMGVSYNNNLINFRQSVAVAVASEFGVSVSATSRSPAYTPYTGSDTKIGSCGSCHGVRGSISIKGQNLGMQFTHNNDVIAQNDHVVTNLFESKIGTVCVRVQSSC